MGTSNDKKLNKKYLNYIIMNSFIKNPLIRKGKKMEIVPFRKTYWFYFGVEIRPHLKNGYSLLQCVSKNQKRLFTIMENDKIIDLLNTKKNNNLYESICPFRKMKCYFDFDLEIKNKPTIEEEEKLFNIVKDKIVETIKTTNLSIDRTEPRKKQGKGNNWKISYHIIVKDKYFNNLKELKECGFYDWIKDVMVDYGLDATVYSMWRYMKYPYQSKPRQSIQMPIDEPEDIRTHTITHFTGNETPIDLSLFKQYKKDNANISVKSIKTKSSKKLISLHKPEYKLPSDFDLKYASSNEWLFLIKPQKYYKRTMMNILECFIYEGGSFKIFWNWNKQAGMWGRQGVDDWDEPEEKYYEEWKNYAIDMRKKGKTYLRRNGIIKALLEKIYNTEIKSNTVDKFLNTFIKTGDIKVGEENEKGYISSEEVKKYSDDKKYTLFNCSMGTGKSYSVMDYINKNQPKRVLLITNRITLGRDQYGKINKMVEGKKFKFYKDVRGELDENYNEMNNEHKRETLAEIDRLIIEVESMKHLAEAKRYDLIVADEIESLFMPFRTDATHGNSYDINWKTFKHSIINAGKVFLMDAYLSTRTTNFIKDIEPEQEQVILYKKKSLNKTYRHYKHFKTMILKIIEDLSKGKRIYLFYPYKTGKGSLLKMSIEELCSIIVKDLPQLKYLVYHGDINDSEKRKLQDVNELWSDKQLIITNSTISVGVSYDNQKEVFDKIYLSYADFLNPRDVIQSSFRIRTTKDNEIGYCYLKSISDLMDYKPSIKEGSRLNTTMLEDKALCNLMKSLELEELAKGQECMERWMELTGYKKTFINNAGISKEEWKEVRTLTEGTQNLWDWDEIFYENTSKHRRNIIRYKQKRDNQTATSEEKLQIEKYEIMRFLDSDLIGEDEIDEMGRTIYKSQMKEFNMINRFLNHKDKEVLDLVFVKQYVKLDQREENVKSQEYYIKIRPCKTWDNEDRQKIFKYIQLDNRYKARYSNEKLQQKIVNSFGISTKKTYREIRNKVKKDELMTPEEKQLVLNNIKSNSKKNTLHNLGLDKIIDTFNQYGRRNHSIHRGEKDELDFLSDSEDEDL